MGGVTLKIHPLFYLFGLYYALTGRIFIFIVYTIVALVHELGHSFVAERLGYRLKSIVLMPYGAVIGGDVKNLRLRDEIAVAAAGPLLNFAIGIFFVATWWIFPDTYDYTSLAAEAKDPARRALFERQGTDGGTRRPRDRHPVFRPAVRRLHCHDLLSGQFLHSLLRGVSPDGRAFPPAGKFLRQALFGPPSGRARAGSEREADRHRQAGERPPAVRAPGRLRRQRGGDLRRKTENPHAFPERA